MPLASHFITILFNILKDLTRVEYKSNSASEQCILGMYILFQKLFMTLDKVVYLFDSSSFVSNFVVELRRKTNSVTYHCKCLRRPLTNKLNCLRIRDKLRDEMYIPVTING